MATGVTVTILDGAGRVVWLHEALASDAQASGRYFLLGVPDRVARWHDPRDGKDYTLRTDADGVTLALEARKAQEAFEL